MPNIKSAEKRMRTSEKARQKNRSVKTGLKVIRRKMLEQTTGAVQTDAEKTDREYSSALDKAVKRGVIPRNTALRRKARAAARVKGGAPAAAPAAAAPAAPAEAAPQA